MIFTLLEITTAISESILASAIVDKSKKKDFKDQIEKLAEEIYNNCILKIDEIHKDNIYRFLKYSSFISRIMYVYCKGVCEDSKDSFITSCIDEFEKKAGISDLNSEQKKIISDIYDFIIKECKKSNIIDIYHKLLNEILRNTNDINESTKRIEIQNIKNQARLEERLDRIDKLLDSIVYEIKEKKINISINNVINYSESNNTINLSNFKSNEEYLYFANLYNKSGEYDKSIEIFESMINEYPKQYDYYNNIGNIYYENNDLEKAIQYFNKVLEIDKENVSALFNLAVASYSEITEKYTYMINPELDYSRRISNELKDCMNYINAAYKINPEDVDVIQFRGFILMATRTDLDEALRLFKLYDRKYSSLTNKINLALCYMIRKEFIEALSIAREIADMNFEGINQAAAVYALLGNLYLVRDIKDINKAKEMFTYSYAINHDKKTLIFKEKISEETEIDSIYYNKMFIDIYTTEELIRMNL